MSNVKMCKNFLPILIIGCLCVLVTLILFPEPSLVYGRTNESLSTIPQEKNQSIPEVENETVHYRGNDYSIAIKSWNGPIQDFGFDKQMQVVSWSVPFDLNATRIQELVLHNNDSGLKVRQDIVIPQTFPILGPGAWGDQTTIAMINNYLPAFLPNSSFNIEYHLDEQKTIYHFILPSQSILVLAKGIPLGDTSHYHLEFTLSAPKSALPPIEQFKSGIGAQNVQCHEELQLVIRWEDGSPACVTLQTSNILKERGWTWNTKPNSPFRIMAQITAQGPRGGPAGWHPSNVFWMEIKSASMAYLFGYNI